MEKVNKVRGIKVKRADRVKIITAIMFGVIPEGEMQTLEAVVKYSVNNTLAVSGGIGKEIKASMGISDTMFSTGLFRLEKRGIITKQGKTIMLHPVYKDIDLLNRFILSFQD